MLVESVEKYLKLWRLFIISYLFEIKGFIWFIWRDILQTGERDREMERLKGNFQFTPRPKDIQI